MTIDKPSFPLKVVFMGTPEFSVPALNALHDNIDLYEVIAVYTQPPKPVGRGYKITKTPIHKLADFLGIPVYTPKSLRNPEAQEQFRSLSPDLAVVAAYGLILPKEILETPHHGCLNIHASLLPRWRGAAPIQRALVAGDSETGITIMKMDEGLDTGPMLTTESIPITSETTTSSLHDQLSQIGAQLLIRTIPGYINKTIPLQPQPTEGITYAQKLSKADSLLDWRQPASALDRYIRGWTPWPGVYFTYKDEVIKVAQAKIVEINSEDFKPGEIIDDHLTIGCGQKTAIQLLKIQRPGGKWLSTEEFLRGYPIPKGAQLLSCPDIN